jgi:HD-GYP domain-containing protein (c-di-GMP phosphodiesterase class II)
MGFINTIYEKLHTHSKFLAEQVWSLTTQILDCCVFKDLYAAKEGVAVAMANEDPASICAHIMWSCFLTHNLMSTYMDANFWNHPAVLAEYVKFLATKSGYDKMEKMDLTVSAMEDDVKKALDMADKFFKCAELFTD